MPIGYKPIRKLANAFGAIILMMIMSNSHAADDACQLRPLGSIDLEVGHQILVPISIESKRAFVALHTGSAFSLIFEPAVEAFGLKRRKFYSQVALVTGSIKLKYLVDVNTLQIGDIRFGKSSLLVYPGKGALVHHDGIPIVGSIGMDVFSTADFELDLARGKLNLFSQDHCPGQVVYWTSQFGSSPLFKDSIGAVYFPIELDGEKLEAVFDSGSTISSLDTGITQMVYGFDEKSTGTERIPRPDGTDAHFYRAMEITAPGLRIADARILLRGPARRCRATKSSRDSKAAGFDACMGVFPLYLGRSVMQTLRIYFATKENVVYYSSAVAVK
jgi:Aspartyl protease